MNRLIALCVVTIVGGLLLLGCRQATESTTPEETTTEDTSSAANDEAETVAIEYRSSMLNLFAPLPETVPSDAYEATSEMVDLGRMLFYETRLSISQEMSCNTCHLLDQYGVDGLPTSVGHDGIPVDRNSPTVYNAALHVAQFWDGRAADVEEQAKGPILAAGEMGMPDEEYVIAILKTIPDYEPLFAAAFPDDSDPINYDNVATAIGAFERNLVTPSRFDLLLEGDESQLNEQEKRGLATFVTVGCASCHAGTTVGGEMYRPLGVIEAYEVEDLGRYNVTGEETDKHVFKVPSLRNVAQTGPYLHNGSIETLEEMVRIMAKHQLGREVTDEQVADIVAFLNTLTGEIPEAYIVMPELPASGPDTPGPYEAETTASTN